MKNKVLYMYIIELSSSKKKNCYNYVYQFMARVIVEMVLFCSSID